MTRANKKLPKEVFLSHSSLDAKFAERLAAMLREHGIPLWYSPTEILGAQQWHDEIGAALARCDWFVIILSPSAVKSEWVRRELLFALNELRYRDEQRYRDRIAPLLIRTCNIRKLSWTLSSFQHIDFRRSFSEGARQLLRIWGKGYRG